jgi:hypothetical protein
MTTENEKIVHGSKSWKEQEAEALVNWIGNNYNHYAKKKKRWAHRSDRDNRPTSSELVDIYLNGDYE